MFIPWSTKCMSNYIKIKNKKSDSHSNMERLIMGSVFILVRPRGRMLSLRLGIIKESLEIVKEIVKTSNHYHWWRTKIIMPMRGVLIPLRVDTSRPTSLLISVFAWMEQMLYTIHSTRCVYPLVTSHQLMVSGNTVYTRIQAQISV